MTTGRTIFSMKGSPRTNMSCQSFASTRDLLCEDSAGSAGRREIAEGPCASAGFLCNRPRAYDVLGQRTGQGARGFYSQGQRRANFDRDVHQERLVANGPNVGEFAPPGRVSVCCSGDPSADGLAELTMGVAARHSSPLQQTDSIRIAWLDAREYIKREDCMKARVLLLSAFAALLVAAANYADEHTKPASKGESVLSVETRLVQVNVVAQDSKGNAITGLTRDDFTL